MKRPNLLSFLLPAFLAACPGCHSAESPVVGKEPAGGAFSDDRISEPLLRYFAAPSKGATAVAVEGFALAHTRTILPVDRQGNLVGIDSATRQVSQCLDNLEKVLGEADARLNDLVKVHLCVDSSETEAEVRQQLTGRLGKTIRPAITSVISDCPIPEAKIAINAVATTAQRPEQMCLLESGRLHGKDGHADLSIMPVGGVVYLSGKADKSERRAATINSVSPQLDFLKQLGLTRRHVSQIKVFIDSMASTDEVLEEIKTLFRDQLAPPVVFVEWTSTSSPVEIEVIAHLPLDQIKTDEPVRFFTPPGEKASPVFCRVVLVQTDRQIYFSGLRSEDAGDGESQVRNLFSQLESLASQTGSDLQHFAKATYYVSDADASRKLNSIRPEFYDPQRPPAASKAMVRGVGPIDRTICIDMIAVPK